MAAVRVLIVDDSMTMRSLIRATLQADPAIEVVGMAGDPIEARQAIKQLNPDVITLDVEMPNMNGLDFLERLMRLRPMPVVMVSTLTHAGAAASLEALELGAVDCVGKPAGNVSGGAFSHLAETVKAAARARVRPRGDIERPVAAPQQYRPNGRMVAIGSSTGGVEALLQILSSFPANCPPTVVTQHMPGTFTGTFAERLNRACAARVSEARNGDVLEAGHVYLAPGGEFHLEVTPGATPRCRLRAGDPVNGHRPSVDVLFESVAKAAGAEALGVILTGMGRDGANGLLSMRRAGAMTIGQNEASCVVYGMPKTAMAAGAVERELPLNQIASAILAGCSSNSVRA
jgi:two-component system chemotaxis response regulator CheB